MAKRSFTKSFKVSESCADNFFEMMMREVKPEPKQNKFKSQFKRLDDCPHIIKKLNKSK